MSDEELFLDRFLFHLKSGTRKSALIDLVNDRLKQLTIPDVVGQSEQYCECDKPTLGKSISRCGTCDEWFKPLK